MLVCARKNCDLFCLRAADNTRAISIKLLHRNTSDSRLCLGFDLIFALRVSTPPCTCKPCFNIREIEMRSDHWSSSQSNPNQDKHNRAALSSHLLQIGVR